MIIDTLMPLQEVMQAILWFNGDERLEDKASGADSPFQQASLSFLSVLIINLTFSSDREG